MDLAELEALREGISRVLDSEAGRLRLHAHIDGKAALDRDLWDRAAGLGWLAIGLPEEAGGLGLGAEGLEILHRELGARAAPGPFAASLSAAQALAEVAGPATCEQWLPRLAAGECSLALAAQTRAGDGAVWLLGAAAAAAALVPFGDRGWALVPMQGAAEVAIWDPTRTMLSLDLSGVEPLAVLPGAAMEAALSRHFALALAADSCAGARAIASQTIAYMKEREQFGRVIASFQALKHRVADLMTWTVTAEEVVSLAVDAVAGGDPDAGVWADLAKVRATETYLQVATDCLQLHGGVGFTWEFDVHVHLKRARLSEMLLAPNAELRDRAARGLAEALQAGRQPLEMAL